MDAIQVSATFPSIGAESLDEFKRLAGEAMERTRGEAGAQQYDWFFSEDQTSCEVRETYDDSDALLAHLGNVGGELEQLVGLGGGLQVEMYGTPSEQLLEATAPFAPTVHSHFQSK